MNRIKRLIMKTLMLVMLCCSITTISGIATSVSAEAAVKAPSVKETKKTLYAGYKSYKISIQNLAKSAAVTYKSSNTKVATVSKGKVNPVKAGTASIAVTVKQNNKTYNLKVAITVKAPTVTFTASTDYLNEGDSFQYEAAVAGMDEDVVYSVSDTSVATITTTGILTALTSGDIEVYAKAGTKKAKQEVVIGSNRLGTFSNDITCYDDTTIWIYASGHTQEETLKVKIDHTDIIDYELGTWNGNYKPLTIKTNGPGTAKITVTTNQSNDRLILNVTVIEKPKAKEKLSSEEIYSKCVPATVEIKCYGSYGEEALGSGFFIGDGVIVTNYHVIEGAEDIQVTTSDNKKYDVTSILGFSASIDLAVLKIKSKNDSLVISREPAKGGEEIYTLGSPLGLTGTMTKGMVSTASRVLDEVDYVQIDASISPGNSGGPLVNAYGEVVGINTMYIENGQNLNFAINIKELQKIHTNWPMTVAEYSEAYDEYMLSEFMSNLIYEDPAKSQSVDTCQYVPYECGVIGTVTITERSDVFFFEMEEPGYFEAYIMYDSVNDMRNIYFDVYDVNGNYIISAVESEEGGTEELEWYLTPGYYVIQLQLIDGYNASDINYLFVTDRY